VQAESTLPPEYFYLIEINMFFACFTMNISHFTGKFFIRKSGQNGLTNRTGAACHWLEWPHCAELKTGAAQRFFSALKACLRG
jgi:hypothetical protein